MTNRERTLQLAATLSRNEISHLIERWCQPNMLLAAYNKFDFDLDKDALQWVLAGEDIEGMILCNDDGAAEPAILSSAPDWVHEPTLLATMRLDENQYDALIERYCGSEHGSKDKSVKLYGFELDKRTLEWLKENRPIYEFLE